MNLLTIDWILLLEKLILIAIVVMVSLLIAMYETYAERKIAAFMQDRIGPNRAGPFGILQPMADGLKLFFTRSVTRSQPGDQLRTGNGHFIDRCIDDDRHFKP